MVVVGEAVVGRVFAEAVKTGVGAVDPDGGLGVAERVVEEVVVSVAGGVAVAAGCAYKAVAAAGASVAGVAVSLAAGAVAAAAEGRDGAEALW